MFIPRGKNVNVVHLAAPGPDPDQVNALMGAACMHRAGLFRLRAVICSGGHQSVARARLAATVLEGMGVEGVPVGAGAPGVMHTVLPYEYSIHLHSGIPQDGATLLLNTITASAPKSVTIINTAGLSDLAQLMRDHPVVVSQKVARVAVKGGVDRQADGRWMPGYSSAFQEDPVAAEEVIAFCRARGIHLDCVDESMAPLIPMRLARSFAVLNEDHSLLSYVDAVQPLSLQALWVRVCQRRAGPQLTKQRFFEVRACPVCRTSPHSPPTPPGCRTDLLRGDGGGLRGRWLPRARRGR